MAARYNDALRRCKSPAMYLHRACPRSLANAAMSFNVLHPRCRKRAATYTLTLHLSTLRFERTAILVSTPKHKNCERSNIHPHSHVHSDAHTHTHTDLRLDTETQTLPNGQTCARTHMRTQDATSACLILKSKWFQIVWHMLIVFSQEYVESVQK